MGNDRPILTTVVRTEFAFETPGGLAVTGRWLMTMTAGFRGMIRCLLHSSAERRAEFGRKSHRTSPQRWHVPDAAEVLELRWMLAAGAVANNALSQLAVPYYQGVTHAEVTPFATASPQGYTPQQIRAAYGFNAITLPGGVTANGAGMTIAIVDAYDDPNIAHDLQQFDLAFGLPEAQLTKVNQSGGSVLPAANTDWITEIALDVQWAHAMAPAANILLVEANSNSFADLTVAIDYARHAPGVVAISMSWGSGEVSAEGALDDLFTTPSGHPGVAFIASSGDGGSPVSYPSASTNVLSVGGTTLHLNSTGGIASEAGWSGSGGGLSTYEPLPAYQQDLLISGTHRMNPDVAYNSDPNTGYPVYDSYNNGTTTPWGQWGGTSAAAPQWAALVAITDQARALVQHDSLDGSTELLPMLYRLPGSDFLDITSGSSNGTPPYNATVGYDLVTGLGSPLAARIVADLTDNSIPTATHFLVLAPANVVSGQPFSVTVKALDDVNMVRGDYLGTIQFSSSDSGVGCVLPLNYTFTADDHGVHTWTGFSLSTVGTQTLTIADAAHHTIAGQTRLTVLDSHSPPTISGSQSSSFVAGQAPLKVAPQLTITDPAHATLAAATITLSGGTSADQLQFVNHDRASYGNIAAQFNPATMTLTLTSAGATATLTQFQAALRAVTYSHQTGSDSKTTRTMRIQVFNTSAASNVLSCSINLVAAATVTQLTASRTSLVAGQMLVLTATVSVVTPGSGIPAVSTSTVRFFDGSQPLPGLAALSVIGGRLTAMLTVAALAPGYHNLTAVFGGDANYHASQSVALNATVFHAGTTLSMTSSSPASAIASPVTLTATLNVISPGSGTPTPGALGQLTFRDGKQPLSGVIHYAVMNGRLTATLTTNALSVGTHLLTAYYPGDSNFLAAASASVKQTILPTATRVTVSSSVSSPTFGTAITFTAIVAAVGVTSAVPNAHPAAVQFRDGTTILTEPVTYRIDHGRLFATLTTSRLSAGMHSISAVYAGDTSFQPATSAVMYQSITPAATQVTLTSSAANSVYGQAVSLTATVSATNAGNAIPPISPTARLVFQDGNQILTGSVVTRVVNGKLLATLTIANFAAGSHAIQCYYTGDANYRASARAAITQIIKPQTTSTVLGSNVASSVVGQPVIFTATVAAAGLQLTLPTGATPSVEFLEAGHPLSGTVTYRVSGKTLTATLTTSALAIGTHVVTAFYTGTSNLQSSQSKPLTHVVTPVKTTTTIVSSIAKPVFGQRVTLTATVASTIGFSELPVSPIQFVEGGKTVPGSVTLAIINNQLVATLTSTALATGIHAIEAVFPGDPQHAASRSPVLSQTVFHAATTLTLSATTATAGGNSTITICAVIGVVSPGAGLPTPGTSGVQFHDGTRLLSGTVTYTAVSGKLVAKLTVDSWAKGVHSLAATYGGDSCFLASASKQLRLLITG